MIDKDLSLDDLDRILNYHFIKKRLFIRLINAPNNHSYLSHVPHYIVGDIAITYRILISYEDGIISTDITNDLFNQYNITHYQLHFDATESSMKVLPLKIIRFPFNNASTNKAFILTNRFVEDGAASIFYPGVLRNISNKLDDDLTIIPISTNECLVTTDTFAYEKGLKEIQQKVKNKPILKEHFLSNSVFHYNKETNHLETDEEYERRTNEIMKN